MEVKGVVMAQKQGNLIFLLEGGEFYKVSHKYYPKAKVGDELNIIKRKPSRYKYIIPLVASFLLFFFLTSVFSNPIYGYVSIDINPSLELSINKRHKVIGVTPLNEQGEETFNSLDLIGKDIDLALSKIVLNFNEQGLFVQQEANLILTIVTTLEKNNDNFDLVIKESVKKALEENQVKNNSYVIPAKIDQRNQSSENGISTAKHVIQQISTNNGWEINKDVLINKGINETLKEKGINVEEVIKEAQEKNNSNNKSNNNSNKIKDEKHPPSPSNLNNNKNNTKDENHPSNRNNTKDENHPSIRNNTNDENHPSNKNNTKDGNHPSNESNNNVTPNNRTKNN